MIRVAGRHYDVALHLLDRQVVDGEGRAVSKVDDLEVRDRDGVLILTAILTGPGALGPRLNDHLGRWVTAVWQRLRSDTTPSPGRVDYSLVTWVDSAVHVSRSAPALGVDGFEQWARTRVIQRLPGAGGTAQVAEGARDERVSDSDQDSQSDSDTQQVRLRSESVRRMSELLGMVVRDEYGERIGSVNDARLVPSDRVRGAMAELQVEGVVIADRVIGSLLGYDRRALPGPWVVRIIVRWLHRRATYAPWSAIQRVDWDSGELTVDRQQLTALLELDPTVR